MARRTRRRGGSVVSRRAKASGLMTLLLAALPAASASGKGFSKEGQNVMNREASLTRLRILKDLYTAGKERLNVSHRL